MPIGTSELRLERDMMEKTIAPPTVAFAGPSIGVEEIEAVTRVMRSGVIAQGPEVAAFEREFAARMGADDAVAVNSGTAALEVALAALEIGVGDEVIVPAFTFIATAATVARTGATVRFADVDPVTFCLDPTSTLSLVTAATRLIVPVDLYGYPAPLAELRVALPEHVTILEDAAQAHGAGRYGIPVGSDELTTFSFYPTKNMTTAEGGIVTCNDSAVAERMRLIRNHGMRGAYDYAMFGANLRMTDISAAIGRCQLDRLDGFIDRRTLIAGAYRSELSMVDLPGSPADGDHAWSVFTIRHPHRDALASHLAQRGVASKVYYPQALSRIPLFDSSDVCPVSDLLAQTVLSLPIRPDLTDAEVEQVIDAVRSF